MSRGSWRWPRRRPSRLETTRRRSRSLLKANVPGALFRVLRPFADATYPADEAREPAVRNEILEYVFLCDFLGHRDDPMIAEALSAIAEECSMLKVFGSYPRFPLEHSTSGRQGSGSDDSFSIAGFDPHPIPASGNRESSGTDRGSVRFRGRRIRATSPRLPDHAIHPEVGIVGARSWESWRCSRQCGWTKLDRPTIWIRTTGPTAELLARATSRSTSAFGRVHGSMSPARRCRSGRSSMKRPRLARSSPDS